MARARRTVRKPTRWTDAEWRRVEDAAPVAGVPALRFVREAALEKADALRSAAPPPAPSRRRRAGDELVHQLARVLNNLRQLQRVAEDDWDEDSVRLIGEVIRMAEAATADAPERAREAAAMLAELGPVGAALNELARRANSAEYLPDEAPGVLSTVYSVLTSSSPFSPLVLWELIRPWRMHGGGDGSGHRPMRPAISRRSPSSPGSRRSAWDR